MPAPEAAITWPADGVTTGDASFTVRGTTSGTSAVAVELGGVAATSSDGFRTWSAAVPLAPGSNQLVVTTRAAGGETDAAAAAITVHRELPLERAVGLDLDAAANLLYVTAIGGIGAGGAVDSAVYRTDLATGARSRVAGAGIGSGTPLNSPGSIAADPANDRLLYSEFSPAGLYALHLPTGQRSALTATQPGAIRVLPFATKFPPLDRFFWLDPTTRSLRVGSSGLEVVADIGNAVDFVLVEQPQQNLYAVDDEGRVLRDFATVITGPTVGSGPQLHEPVGIAFDAPRDRFLVLDTGRAAVVVVDRGTGARSILSDAANGAGPEFGRPRRLVLQDDRALVVDSRRGAVLAVDLVTGDRSIVTGPARGTGAALPGGRGAARLGDRLYLGQFSSGEGSAAGVYGTTLAAVDPATGARTIVSDNDRGSGPRLNTVFDVCADAGRSRLVVAMKGLLSGPASLSESFSQSLAFSIDQHFFADHASTEGVLLKLDDSSAGVGDITVQLRTTGGAVLASGTARRVRPGAVFAVRWASQPLSLGQEYVLRVDGSNSRQRIATNFVGNLGSMVVDGIDLYPQGLFVQVSRDDSRLCVVDPATGDRTILSNLDTGSGPPLPSFPSGVAHDAVRDEYLVAGGDDLIAVDPETGARRALPVPGSPVAVTVVGDRALLAFRGPSSLGALDLVTGQFTEISGPGRGTGPALPAVPVCLETDGERLFVGCTQADDPLFVVDLASGDRAVLDVRSTGHHAITGLWLDDAAGLLHCADDFGPALFAVDLGTGNTLVLSR
ncbi:MAG: hypothetical protein AB7O97_12325 [Planctomycetota bacterium]